MIPTMHFWTWSYMARRLIVVVRVECTGYNLDATQYTVVKTCLKFGPTFNPDNFKCPVCGQRIVKT